MKHKHLLAVLLALLLLAGNANILLAQPPMLPALYAGTLTVYRTTVGADGVLAPAGVSVITQANGVSSAANLTTADGRYGTAPYIYLKVGASGNVALNAAISFYASGVAADQTDTFVPGKINCVNATSGGCPAIAAGDFNLTVKDTVPPVISGNQPTGTVSIGNVTITASYSDALAGIGTSPSPVTVFTLDGADLTAQATISSTGVSATTTVTGFGTHIVSLSVRDRVGNVGSLSWIFTIPSPPPVSAPPVSPPSAPPAPPPGPPPGAPPGPPAGVPPGPPVVAPPSPTTITSGGTSTGSTIAAAAQSNPVATGQNIAAAAATNATATGQAVAAAAATDATATGQAVAAAAATNATATGQAVAAAAATNATATGQAVAAAAATNATATGQAVAAAAATNATATGQAVAAAAATNTAATGAALAASAAANAPATGAALATALSTGSSTSVGKAIGVSGAANPAATVAAIRSGVLGNPTATAALASIIRAEVTAVRAAPSVNAPSPTGNFWVSLAAALGISKLPGMGPAMTTIWAGVMQNPVVTLASAIWTEVFGLRKAPALAATGGVGSPAPVGAVLAKLDKNIQGARITIEDVATLPSGVPTLPDGKIVSAYVRLTPQNFGPQNLVASDVTFSVDKSWLKTNGIHPFSVSFMRYDESRKVWVDFTGKWLSEDDQRIYYTANTNAFSLWAIAGSKQLPPVQFKVDGLKIDSASVQEGQTVTIQAQVTNLTDQAGDYNVSLWLNDVVETTKTVSVPAKGVVPVSFSVQAKAGSYNVRVDSQVGSFSVTPAQVVTPTPTPVQTPTLTPTPTPVQTPTLTPTPTPVKTPTLTPSPTPAPKPTVTPSPTPTPQPKPSNTPLVMLIIILVVLAIIGGVVFFLRRSRSSQ